MENNQKLFALILAGGSGTRLWPRSRQDWPKQLLSLFSECSLLQETYDRIAPIIPAEHVFVITNQSYVQAAHDQLPQLPLANIIGEPEGRGTAPAIGLAALYMRRMDPEGVMVSLHADHYIARADDFRRAVLQAAEVARSGMLVTLGIQPSRPETGYGYIHRGELLGMFDQQPVYRISRFIEKPDGVTAAQLVASGEYSWNSGIFTWQFSTLFQELSRHMPTLSEQLNEIAGDLGTESERSTLARVWTQVENQTIDSGLMERCTLGAMLPIDIGWSDVGNWDTLFELLPHDLNMNVVVGEHVTVKTTSSLLYSPNRMIAAVGVENLIVVDAGDAILICSRDRAQEVKHVVEALRKKNQSKYL